MDVNPGSCDFAQDDGGGGGCPSACLTSAVTTASPPGLQELDDAAPGRRRWRGAGSDVFARSRVPVPAWEQVLLAGEDDRASAVRPQVVRASLSRVVVFINGKGGVGKTTVTANVAGLLAASGRRVLAVDLDPQGNLGRDLGYRRTERDDDGASLALALAQGAQVTPLEGVRERLDVLRGGAALDAASTALSVRPGEQADALANVLVPLAGSYDLILIDAPPGNEALQNAAIAAARWVVVPSKADAASADGLALVASRIDRMLAANPGIDLLGVALFGIPVTSTAVRREARESIAALVGEELVFETVVRHSDRFASDARKHGLLAHELDHHDEAPGPVDADPSPWWQLRGRKPAPSNGPAHAPATVAGDLHALTAEILERILAREAGVAG